MMVPENTDYKFLSIMADAKPHTWMEIVYMGTIYLNTKQPYTEKLVNRALEYNWIGRKRLAASLQLDTLELLKKGDEFYRYMAIRRNPEDFRLYRYFNRQENSTGAMSFGMDKISPLDSRLSKMNNNGNGHI